MILTIKDLKEAIDDIPEDNIIYVKTMDGDIFDISRINDATSVGFWELRLSNTCTAYTEAVDNQQKLQCSEYIGQYHNNLHDVLPYLSQSRNMDWHKILDEANSKLKPYDITLKVESEENTFNVTITYPAHEEDYACGYYENELKDLIMEACVHALSQASKSK